MPALQLVAPLKMNSEEFVPEREAVEQEEIALPVLATEKIVAAPDDPTATLPRLTEALGEKLSLAAEAFKEMIRAPKKKAQRVVAFVASIENSLIFIISVFYAHLCCKTMIRVFDTIYSM